MKTIRIVTGLTLFVLGIGVGVLLWTPSPSVSAQAPCEEMTKATIALRPGVPFAASCTKEGAWSLEWQSTTVSAPTIAEINAKAAGLETAPPSAYPAYEAFVDAMLECVSGAACDKAAAIRDSVNAKKTAEGKPLLTGNSPGGKKVVQATVTP